MGEKKDNKGMSLVEILIVLAVIGILAGTSFVMFGHIRHANVKKAVETIDTELDRQRAFTMSKKEVPSLYIYHLEDGYFMRALNEEILSFDRAKFTKDGVKLCGSETGIYMDTAGGTKVDGDVFIRITYKRDGSFDYTEISGSKKTNVMAIVMSGTEQYCITLIPETGRHEVGK